MGRTCVGHSEGCLYQRVAIRQIPLQYVGPILRNHSVAFWTGPRYYATWRLLIVQDRIEKRIELKAPPARGWRALTDYREFGQWFRVKLDGPFVPGEISRGHITHPGYEHVKWYAVVQKMEPE